MENQGDFNRKILFVTLKIQEEYPELIKYLEEMPSHSICDALREINDKDLREYLEMLNGLLHSYSHNH